MFSDPFDQPGQGQNNDMTSGDRLVGRIMSEEYNLAVQREPGWQKMSPGGILAQMAGEWLSNRFSR